MLPVPVGETSGEFGARRIVQRSEIEFILDSLNIGFNELCLAPD
jgi:hypothetical protein